MTPVDQTFVSFHRDVIFKVMFVRGHLLAQSIRQWTGSSIDYGRKALMHMLHALNQSQDKPKMGLHKHFLHLPKDASHLSPLHPLSATPITLGLGADIAQSRRHDVLSIPIRYIPCGSRQCEITRQYTDQNRQLTSPLRSLIVSRLDSLLERHTH